MPEIFEVTISTGRVLDGLHWPAENAKANLCVQTGMAEYAKRYDHFAAWLAERGVNVWVLDTFGQGENAESPDVLEIWPVNAFTLNVDAIHQMDEMAKKNGLPTVQMGHSMGSFMVQSLIERYPLGTDKVIIMGSNGGQAGLMKLGYFLAKLMVNDKNRDKPNALLSAMGLGSYAKAIKGARTDCDWLSYNVNNVDAYIADPYCGHEATAGFWKEFLKALSVIWDKDNMDAVADGEKILVISGEEDPVGQMGKGPRWLAETYRKLGVKDVTLKIWPHMRHEILNEDDRETVYQYILDYILA